jgi:hypothetical protein
LFDQSGLSLEAPPFGVSQFALHLTPQAASDEISRQAAIVAETEARIVAHKGQVDKAESEHAQSKMALQAALELAHVAVSEVRILSL